MKNKEFNQYVIGVDIGGTHIRIGAVDHQKKVHSPYKLKTNEVIKNDDPIDALGNFLEKYIAKEVDLKNVLAICLGFPSVVSKDRKKIYDTPNFNYLSNINIVDPLQEKFNVPVLIDNDVNNLLKFEINKRNVSDDQIVVGFYIGTGFGNAIYINGKILEGKNGVAGELGHTPVLGKNDLCECGNVGCVENYASGKRLVQLHKMYFSDIQLKDIFKYYSEDERIKEFIDAMAVPIATEINIFDPHLVILGGGVVGMEGFPKEEFEKNILKYVRKPYPYNGLVIEYAEDDSSAGIIGSTIDFFHNFPKINSKYNDKVRN